MKRIARSVAKVLVAVAVLCFMQAGAVLGQEAQDSQSLQPPPGMQQPQQVISQAEAFTLMAGEAEKGNPAAMLTLGVMYERGIGTPRNFIKAFEWYGKAATANMAEGYYNVGVCYEIGMGNGGDPAKAFYNFEKSAELGLAQGLYKLATLYFIGFGTTRNEPWGVELLNRAAAAGHMVAANQLGVIYFEGRAGQAKDEGKAFTMFSRAAELGNAEAMKNLAVFYRDGLGRPADPPEELKWYTLARRAGFPAGAVDAAIQQVSEKLGPDATKKVEETVEAWIADFQSRQAQAQQAEQAQQGAQQR